MEDEGKVLLINKPLGWSSQKTVTEVKKNLNLKKAGHAGTLDPLATGLLLVLTGKATKSFSKFQKMKKEYIARVKFGMETDTGDLGGVVIRTWDDGEISYEKERICKELNKMTGEQLQTPPVYSAVKVSGMAAYKRTRMGETVELRPKKVIVYEAELMEVKDGEAKIKFVVSSGTYIRVLAMDLGRRLGSGAVLSGLERTRIGEYGLDQARKFDFLSNTMA